MNKENEKYIKDLACMDEKQLLFAILNVLPTCLGTILGGSGGHTRYANDCKNKATWFNSDGCYFEPFCDEHEKQILTNHLIYREEYCYADEIRAWTNYINRT